LGKCSSIRNFRFVSKGLDMLFSRRNQDIFTTESTDWSFALVGSDCGCFWR
jgi:hypothetical protein